MPGVRVPRALVIGAGVGGLTAAAALHRTGWEVLVLERAPAPTAAGAALAVTPNAIRALDVVGLGDSVRALRTWSGEGGLRVPSGRRLAGASAEALAERFGGPVVPVPRAFLIGLLQSALPAGAVLTGAGAMIEDPGSAGSPARVRAGGEEREADLVVAADGIHSAARPLLFPRHPAPVYAGFTTWRMLVPAPAGPLAPHETWGRGALWGTQPLADGRVYAYAAAALPPGGHAPDGERAELLRRFGAWHRPVPDLIEAAAPDGVLRSDVYVWAGPPPAYHRGRTVLLGDAAHPMAPTLGQGGNQAIEDGVVLAHHATPGAGLDAALAAYSADRLPRTAAMVRRATRLGRLVTMTSAAGCALRDTGMGLAGLLGPRLALRALDGIADWSPPQRLGP